MGAVRHSERVVDEDVAQRRPGRGERRVVPRLAVQEARVLEQGDPSGLELSHRAGDHAVVLLLGNEAHRPPEQLGQPLGDGSERELRCNPFRTAQVRKEDDPRPGSGEELERGHRRTQPMVIGHTPLVERHVEVGAHHRSPPAEPSGIDVGDRLLHARALAAISGPACVPTVRSPLWPEASRPRSAPDPRPSTSSPIRCRTRTGPSPCGPA